MTRNVTLRHGVAAALVLFGLAAIAQMPGGPPGGGIGAPPVSAPTWEISEPEVNTSYGNDSPISGVGTAPDPNLSFIVKLNKSEFIGDDSQSTTVSSDSGTTVGQAGQGEWSATCPVPSSGEFPPSTEDRSYWFDLYSAQTLVDGHRIILVDE